MNDISVDEDRAFWAAEEQAAKVAKANGSGLNGSHTPEAKAAAEIAPGLPAPPVPADCDLRSFPDMPLDVKALRDSGMQTEVTPEAGWYAVQLWAASWHQLPAGSLPKDDPALAYLAGLGRDLRTWKKVRPGALRGWQECSDGRLYHAFVAGKVSRAWSIKRGFSRGAEHTNSLKRPQTGGRQAQRQANAQQSARRTAYASATKLNREENPPKSPTGGLGDFLEGDPADTREPLSEQDRQAILYHFGERDLITGRWQAFPLGVRPDRRDGDPPLPGEPGSSFSPQDRDLALETVQHRWGGSCAIPRQGEKGP